MSSSSPLSHEPHWLFASMMGALRGAMVKSVIYPMQVVKMHRQCSRTPTMQIVTKMWRQGDIKAFYRGLQPELIKIAPREVWVWPLITRMPKFLGQWGVKESYHPWVVGSAYATVDAGVMTPLDKAKVRLGLGLDQQFSFKRVYSAQAWHGLGSCWAKRFVNMTTFLWVQDMLKRRYQTEGKPLSMFSLCVVGVQTGLAVSLASSPVDRINTLVQSGKWRGLSHMGLRGIYQGFIPNTMALVLHNVASVILLHYLKV